MSRIISLRQTNPLKGKWIKVLSIRKTENFAALLIEFRKHKTYKLMNGVGVNFKGTKQISPNESTPTLFLLEYIHFLSHNSLLWTMECHPKYLKYYNTDKSK
jgi:hypothetical protein